MTAREIKIMKALLNVAHDLDGGQAGEIMLHAEVNLTVPCSAMEFAAVLELADRKKWLTGITSKFSGKMKYNISDAGEAARLEM